MRIKYWASLRDPDKDDDYYYCESCGSSFDELVVDIDEEFVEAYESVGCYGGSAPDSHSRDDVVSWLFERAGEYPWIKSDLQDVATLVLAAPDEWFDNETT